MDGQNKYWFSAKTYGIGWGSPASWQGWVVYAVSVAFVALLFHIVPPASNRVLFAICIALFSAVLAAVFWLKGEPLQWRWGKQDRP